MRGLIWFCGAFFEVGETGVIARERWTMEGVPRTGVLGSRQMVIGSHC